MRKNTFLKFISILIATIITLIFFNFPFLSDKDISAQEEKELMQELAEKCLIDVEIRNGFEAGKIPIGETVDYTELYIREIIRNLNIMITNTEKAANTAYNKKTEDDLYGLPPQIRCDLCEAVNLSKEVCTLNEDTGEEECECVDCGCRCLECGCCPDCGEECPSSNCGIGGCGSTEGNKGKSTSGSCSSNCTCNENTCTSGSCKCTVDCSACKEDDEAFCKCEYSCSCSGVAPFCEPLTKFSAGVKIIQAAYKKIVIANNNIANLVNVEGKITLCNCPKIDLGFIGGEIEIPEQLNRWKITTAFTNSRNKLENCLMGYARVLRTQRATATLLSCLVALDRINLADLLVVPGFNKFASKPKELCFEKLAPEPSEVCYPYNSKAFLTDDEINACKQNKDGNDCYETVKDLMYNFFCCIGGD